MCVFIPQMDNMGVRGKGVRHPMVTLSNSPEVGE